ncbi:hypothetical protein [Dinghuibacter silviterrae]|uniref:BNR repeat protein n=1 Tax=Dinghuibacter silviterrae TaxID=1539049 RepID=A0A4V3GM14_9BACT|nr:hypothetical protein [Dinghuibacter silviterrae]TDX01643.1 hypothetical protein EDB95_2684 [Dinghuibacter silviterrae]
MSTKRRQENGDTLIAPGGPISRERIVPVYPEKIIQFDDLGRPNLIPRKQLPSRPALRDEMTARGLILTPGGFRPSILIHQMETGQLLQMDGPDIRIMERDTGIVVNKLAHQAAQPDEVPALGSGWISYAYWNNGTGQPIALFKCNWQVPPEPESRNNQTIFLFNGIQNFGANYGILQPVLQWGPSAAGGGNTWSVASWYVTAGGNAFFTPLVPVNAGDVLTGVIRCTGQTGNLYNYTCGFEGINGTLLNVNGINELLWCAQTLEAYAVDNFADYPSVYDTRFRGINIVTGNGTPRLNWTPVDAVTDCGQHCVVVSNSAVTGEVDIFYRFKQIMNDTAVQSPGAVEFMNKVVVAWAGTDPVHHLNVIQSQEEDVWFDKITLADTSPTGVSLCSFSGRLYMAWAGGDNRMLNVMSSADGLQWEHKITLPETSISRPWLAADGDNLVLCWTGADPQQHLNVLFSADGITWRDKRILNETSISSPALMPYKDRLYIAWTGTDMARSLNVMSTRDFGATWQNKVTLSDTAVAGPGLIVYEDKLYLSWSGTDPNHSLNIMQSADGIRFDNKVTFWDSSDFTPMLTSCYFGDLGVVWTGRDPNHHLNIMTI